MTTPRRLALGLILAGLAAPAASAQVPPAAQPAPANPAQPAPAQQPAWPKARQSVVHHYAYPYPGYYHGDSTGGFRNPGGQGRYLEYYPPGNQFQVNPQQDAVKVATFGGGGIPDRNEQLAAQQLGVAKYNAIQGHIDSMARPMWGVGFFGGW